jgi:arylsulfatase A-like enzyme
MKARALGAGLAGGLVAGALVGAAEAVAAWSHAHGAGELPAIGWALVVYGALGGAAGLGAGIVAAVLGTDGFALALAGVGAALGFVVGRFRIVRDVFLEQVPRGLVPLAVQVLALVAVLAAAGALWWWLRGSDARRRPLTRPGVAALVIALLAAAWAGIGGVAPSPPVSPPAAGAAAPGKPNVVLIVVDTLRADRLGCYGYAGARTPRIDALALEGIRYENGFAQASWTRPSFATIFSSLYPSSHGAAHKADILPDRVDTLAELLQRAGYHTVGFANNANISPAFNFQQGFDDYQYLAPDHFFWAGEPAAQLALYSGLRLVRERFLARSVHVRNYYQPAEEVTARVRRWLGSPAAARRPFFLFVHYMDPHDPYFVHPYNGEGYARVANPNPPASVAEKYSRLYDGEIAHLDEHLGALLNDLKTRGLYEQSLIVFTADHGEEFQEHGGWWHGTTLYDEQIRIPLLVKPAGAPAGNARMVEELASSIDVAPTILAAAGVDRPLVLQGHVLPLDGRPAPARESVFAEEDLEGNVLQAVRSRAWKFISANPGNPRGLPPEQLFDLPAAPGEKRDVLRDRPEQAEIMRAARGNALLQARAHAGAAEQGKMDAATLERLKALGYVH